MSETEKKYRSIKIPSEAHFIALIRTVPFLVLVAADST